LTAAVGDPALGRARSIKPSDLPLKLQEIIETGNDRVEGIRPATRTSMHHRLLRPRGASMVEYALLIIAIMLLAAVAYRKLGKVVRQNADESSGELAKRGAS
jgi:Flp pilus assembly pilin Flp